MQPPRSASFEKRLAAFLANYSPPARVRFFEGRLLNAADFQQEQQYHNRKRWLHNLLAFGPGAVAGLKVTHDGPAVSVSPGIAIDPLGREIVVCKPVVLKRDSASRAPRRRSFVVLRYVEEPIDPVAQLSLRDEHDAAGTPLAHTGEFTSIRDGYKLTLDATPPADPEALVLATIVPPGRRRQASPRRPR